MKKLKVIRMFLNKQKLKNYMTWKKIKFKINIYLKSQITNLDYGNNKL